MNRYKKTGWFNESVRHGLARRGIRTGTKSLGKINFDVLESKKKFTAEILRDILPHGSGINGDWNVYEKDGKIIAENYYDTMTETGFYDRPAYFRIIIDKNNPKDFKLQFTDKTSQYLNTKYMLIDYLEDTVHNSLEEGAKQHKINYSIESYKGRGVFDPFYESNADTDNDGIPDLYDLNPTNPEKGIEWSKKPKIEVYDDERFADRYTVVVGDDVFTMSDNPTHPQGINQYSGKIEKGEHIEESGDRLKTIPEAVKKGLKSRGIDYAVTWDWAKPEIKGQQLRIRVKNPVKGAKFGTQDVGKKGRLQRVAQKTAKGWETQSFRLNLSDYENIEDVKKELGGIKGLLPQKKSQALKEAKKYFNIDYRKVTPREFFIHRFGRDSKHRVEKSYFKEWEGRFASGHPESYMDNESLEVYRKLKEKKMRYPKDWKGKGGISVRLVEQKI